MDLFHFQEEAPGSVFWHPKGWTLFQTLIAYMRRRLAAAGYTEVNSPDMMEKHFWELSGHWENYREMMFVTELPDERVFCCKPMNCPGHVQIFKHGLKSYRDLPLKIGEFGKVHRYEPSGAMHGLLRVRHFTQDDAHIFITEDQLEEQCLEVNDLLLSIYEDFGFKDIVVKLSTRPEKRVGTDEQWDHAEAIMGKVLKEIERRGQGPHQDVDQPRRGRLLRAEVRVRAEGRHRPRLAVRHDAGRFQPAGPARRLLHRRALGEEDAGDDPPRHLRLARALHRRADRELRRALPAVAGAAAGRRGDDRVGCRRLCARGVAAQLQARRACASSSISGTRRSTTRCASTRLAKVPVMLVVGKREAEERKVSIRRLGSQDQKVMPLDEAIASLAAEATPPDIKRTSTGEVDKAA